MTINPIAFAEDVNRQFLRYQLTAFPLSDPDMARQAQEMLGKGKRDSQLVKGPFISLSRPFAKGKRLRDLVTEGQLHPTVAAISEQAGIGTIYAHQQAAFDAIKQSMHCLISTGTGSGKTEAFLYPILDHCFRAQDKGEKSGIVAIIVYPMNALAQDQLERLRGLLAGTGITFGMYVGSTPDSNDTATDIKKMNEGEGPEKIAEYKQRFLDHPDITIAPYEERISEAEMREDPPRIMLTNVNQLEFLLTRGKDLGMFSDAPLRFLVFDEAHTYTGTRGAEVSLLIRRIRAFCNKSSDEVICIGTSATIVDPEQGDMAAKKFAHRFFGIDPEKVVLVKEVYDQQSWAPSRIKAAAFGASGKTLFETALNILDGEVDQKSIATLLESISSQVADGAEWRSTLYYALRSNEVVKVIYEVLSEPMPLHLATVEIWKRLGRGQPTEEDEFEILTYLALGAAAEEDGMPLLRPQMHYFVRGLGGAAATLREENTETMATLYFSKQKALEKEKGIDPLGIFPVLSCKNCGQHYFQTWVARCAGEDLEGNGLLDGDITYWPTVPEQTGLEVVFTNRFVSELEELDDSEEYAKRLDKKRLEMFACRRCGTLHSKHAARCAKTECGHNEILPIFVLNKSKDISTCPSCGAKGGRSGGRNRSPLRSLSAVQVADVHILAQDMVNSTATDNRKLIVFADNRQDAAFQAAWMADHARRYRLRHLIYLIIKNAKGPLSIGDVQRELVSILKKDKDLARTIAPEVFASEVEEDYSSRLDQGMNKFLRIAILRELATSYSRQENLESWGKARVVYSGLNEQDQNVQSIALKYHIPSEDLVDGIENMLDMFRRSGFLYDAVEPIFSHYWREGDEEVQRGFLPFFSFPPKGLKLSREEGDNRTYVTGIQSKKGQTAIKGFIAKWGVDDESQGDLIVDVWECLTRKWRLLTPVTLKSNRGNPLPGAMGVYQVDSAKMGIEAQNIRFECSICGRIHTRDSPNHVCTAPHCRGRLNSEVPPEDDYNISLLNREFLMLVAKEHTAQVPALERHQIEKEFKKENSSINCIVATPTLELGVDIGSLDMVLMRNMPPLPSNYWQRAGRAGRRHRMAVIYTYCRKSVHDEYFFEDPMRILSGRISPPRFNMRNPVMIEKHAHATVLSHLFRSTHGSEADALRSKAIETIFPKFIRDYILEGNSYRSHPLDVDGLKDIISGDHAAILTHVSQVFEENWPEEAAEDVEASVLQEYVQNMPGRLTEHVYDIYKRMEWARKTKNDLAEKSKHVVALEETERKVLMRCSDYLEKLMKNDLENYTLNVLARQGFLPGYALTQGNVTAFVGKAYSTSWRRMSFELPRPSTLAVREYVPGNLIYANGGKYKTAYYHLPLDKQGISPDSYQVDVSTQSVFSQDAAPSDYASDTLQTIQAIPICDLDLAFMSHVSDEEQSRFRMPVFMTGLLKPQHRGIDQYRVHGPGLKELSHHHGQSIRLINIGPADQISQGRLGFPICAVCGATRSPYGSEAEINHFKEGHKKSCGIEPTSLALSADSQVDGLLFKDLESGEQAINLAEAVRLAASIQLEMDQEDLQILMLPRVDGTFDVLLYDPMPGGSGLIDQILEGWSEILGTGKNMLLNCPNACVKSCYECMKTYRNSFNHDMLDRNIAAEMLDSYKGIVELIGRAPAQAGALQDSGEPTNLPEMRLSHWLKEKGFNEFQAQVRLELLAGKIGHTIPDFYYASTDGRVRCAAYLDGLSKGIHGSPEVQVKDRYIRSVLESMGIRVVVIAASDLDDPEMMDLHLANLSQILSS